MKLIETGTKIYASIVRPGMLIETEDGERIEVQKIVEGYNTWTLDNLWGHTATVDYAAKVKLLGYFNTDN